MVLNSLYSKLLVFEVIFTILDFGGEHIDPFYRKEIPSKNESQ